MKISEPGACEAPGKHTSTNEDELDEKIVDVLMEQSYEILFSKDIKLVPRKK